MELLLENEDKLQLSWHPGCYYYNGKYTLGDIGRRGPGVTDEDLKKPWVCQGVPSSISFNIRFKNKDDIDLFNKLLSIIKKLEGIDVKFYDNCLKKEKIKIKDEFREKVDEIEERNKNVREKYLILIKQLEDLGCYLDSISGPKYEQISNDWYEWQESYDATMVSINVLCHDNTHFYLFLKEHGILDKYFPEWYKLGNF